jgi:outer membrane protein insertion porin family
LRSFIVAILVLFSTTLCFAQAADWYQGKTIRDIRFEGLKHVRTSELNNTIETYRNQPFSDDLFLELQSKLFALEYFELITPTLMPTDAAGSEVVILFRVVERPVVSRITFSGNTGVRRRELMDAITTKVNDVANSMVVRSDETAVHTKYLEKGFPDVQVSSEIKAARDDMVELIFHITEGQNIVISDVYFEGNTIFSSSSLRSRLSMKPKGIGPGRSGSFQEAKFIADREALNRYYRDKGYLDAEVTDVIQDTTRDSKGNNNMVITYRLYEGRVYTFNGITFEGNDIFTSEQLQALVRSKVGETANASTLEADLQRIANRYYENGYIYNSIDREEIRNTQDGLIAFKVSIVERGRAHIENIIIRGNDKTKDFVIRREIPLEPGDIYSNAKVLTGLRNLMNLQYFSTVLPEPVPGSEDGLMDLVINVE